MMMEILESGARRLGINLSPRQLEQFGIYYRELAAWNGRMNLTAITGCEDVQTRHFLDSLTVITGFRPEDKERPVFVIDVGTGAGLPGIPLKIIRPDIKLVLLEATVKKTKFLEHVAAQLGLKGVQISAARAEDAARDARYREKFDLVLSRAVAPLAVLAELALPFSAVGGRFIAQKKGAIGEELARAAKAVAILGGASAEIKPVAIEGLGDSRVLVLIDKTRPTPPAYPRRSGMPAKNPLGG